MEIQIDKVKKKLWSWGYSCVGVPPVPGLEYDLVVESKFLVKVMNLGNEIKRAKGSNIIYALVGGDDITYVKFAHDEMEVFETPTKVFPKI